MTISRTIHLDDLTPQEIAFAFCEMDSDDQAAFFATVWQIGRTWSGTGWCQQSSAIVASLAKRNDLHGREAVRTLASHLPAEDVSWIVAASSDGGMA